MRSTSGLRSISLELREFASGWRGIALIAITYVYFLIFAQFAFLSRLAELGLAQAHLQAVMAAMALGGIATSLLAGWWHGRAGRSVRGAMAWALGLCGAAALLSLLQLNLAEAAGVALLIGVGLGLLTVTEVTHLPLWLGGHHRLLQVGLGTGLGYLICNLPVLFTAGPRGQAATAAALCVAGALVIATGTVVPTGSERPRPPSAPASFAQVLLCFTALIWFDSAAFYIIQHTAELKAGTWQGTAHLWTNGGLHLAAALVSAWWLRRSGLLPVLYAAFAVLAAACLLLQTTGGVLLASAMYPVGVSLYSVALVAYPALLGGGVTLAERARRAGLIYAVAGWGGSAMGIGMAQHLHHVPQLFVALAALLVLGAAAWRLAQARWREGFVVAAALLLAVGVDAALPSSTAARGASSAVQRGRRVYIAEGCINCHSQYVRPHTADVLMWGPVQTLQELRAQDPPLIGNRRQGPDLSQVGGRRSQLWLHAHLVDPQALNPTSFMPAYGYLFQGSSRGDDLVAYLSSLRSAGYASHIALEQQWQPAAAAVAEASPTRGSQLFGSDCATCHARGGATRIAWAGSFRRMPPELLAPNPHTAAWQHVEAAAPGTVRRLQLARIVKFGIPATDMPGHEYLSDADVASLALWLDARMHSTDSTASSEPPVFR